MYFRARVGLYWGEIRPRRAPWRWLKGQYRRDDFRFDLVLLYLENVSSISDPSTISAGMAPKPLTVLLTVTSFPSQILS